VPIRTNRGRAAVYRRLWGWPLRSPKHLMITAFLVAVVGTTTGIALPKLLGGPETRPIASTGTQSDTQGGGGDLQTGGPGQTPGGSPASPTMTRLSPVDSRTSAAPDPVAVEVALNWGTAWVKHDGVTKDQWLAALEPYTTEEYLRAKMSTVDIANIGATRVTGTPVAKASYSGSLTVTLPTDGPKLEITLIKTATGWRVAGYEEAS
jgi:hypothetical protein